MLLDLGDLQVRSWRKSDLDALLRHANNAKIAANLRDQFPHPYTRRDAIDYLDFVRDQRPERLRRQCSTVAKLSADWDSKSGLISAE